VLVLFHASKLRLNPVLFPSVLFSGRPDFVFSVVASLSSSHGVGAARPDFSLPLRFLFSSRARQLSRSPRFGCSLAQHRTAY
jgi:hypothetical protein